MEQEIILQARGIRKTYGTLEVLRGIDLEVRRGEIVSIVGASGAGKTTLLQILGTLSEADAGSSLTIDGQEVARLSASESARLRARAIGFVFQSHQLLPEFTAVENVMLPAMIIGKRKKDAKARALELLERLGLGARADHRPSELSGGECQRVAVARALMNEPSIILADEPSGSLDSKTKEELHSLFFELRATLGQTFVIITHDTELARRADRMITLKDGVIERIDEQVS